MLLNLMAVYDGRKAFWEKILLLPKEVFEHLLI